MHLAKVKFFMKPILDMPSLLYITTNFSEQSNAMSQGNFFGLFLRSDQITLKMSPYWLCHHDCLLHTKVTNPAVVKSAVRDSPTTSQYAGRYVYA